MSFSSFIQYAAFLAVVTALVKPAGSFLARVFQRERTWLDPVLRPVERFIYCCCRIDPEREMGWKEYALTFILFSAVGTLGLYGILRLQRFVPGGPAASVLTTPLTPDLSMNTAISFSTTSTWQAYGGENTMKNWTQLIGLVGQNFLAGAAGLAIGMAFIRGFSRRDSKSIGNFWSHLVRAVLWVLLPISIIGSVLLVWQGVPMTFADDVQVTGIEGASQIMTRGPVAALELIKNLGTNGGGFFNANGAHPFEGPTPLVNWISMLCIAVLPASLTYTLGKMVGKPRVGWILYLTMLLLFVGGLVACHRYESIGNPRLGQLGISSTYMEGKEVRFGLSQSVLTAITTSNAATGSTNAAPDSLSPIGNAVCLCNMLLGEIVFGGLGTGLYSLVMVALVGLFIAGLMTGRTPEYLGKKIGPAEIKLISIFSLMTPIAILVPLAVTVIVPQGLAGLTTNDGQHGFTEIFYAYASCCANNGQVMGGLSANSPFYNLMTAGVMMVGRFGLAIPTLASAGRFAGQGRRLENAGSIRSDSSWIVIVTLCTAVLLVLLNFLPALALGPILESLNLR